ncbi:HK97 family phage prohead protease [Mycobacterium sp. SMC-13]|uniref:HK97 family phage prohead protease n=1 Tax=Mycobacterium sp. SMC-13 TaxID=3381626 RepID=UPI003877159A
MTAAQASKTLPREDLCRSAKFTLLRSDNNADGEDDGLTFEGYGAVFDSPTRIDSWEGLFDEQIAAGAFRKSIRELIPKFQFDHGRSVFGSLPCGVITDIHEDDNGLFVQARMSSSWFWEPLREAIASQAVDGMSFRFSVVRDEWRDNAGKLVKPEEVDKILYYGEQPERTPLLRILKEVRVAEVGPVVWPAYPDTTAGLRSKVIDLDRLRDGDPEHRKLFAATALTIRTVEESREDPGQSDAAPQGTTPDGVAAEHPGEDDDAPRSTCPNGHAAEHPSNTPQETPPTDEIDAARAAEEDRLFREALNEVMNQRDAHPPMKGL